MDVIVRNKAFFSPLDIKHQEILWSYSIDMFITVYKRKK